MNASGIATLVAPIATSHVIYLDAIIIDGNANLAIVTYTNDMNLRLNVRSISGDDTGSIHFFSGHSLTVNEASNVDYYFNTGSSLKWNLLFSCQYGILNSHI